MTSDEFQAEVDDLGFNQAVIVFANELPEGFFDTLSDKIIMELYFYVHGKDQVTQSLIENYYRGKTLTFQGINGLVSILKSLGQDVSETVLFAILIEHLEEIEITDFGVLRKQLSLALSHTKHFMHMFNAGARSCTDASMLIELCKDYKYVNSLCHSESVELGFTFEDWYAISESIESKEIMKIVEQGLLETVTSAANYVLLMYLLDSHHRTEELAILHSKFLEHKGSIVEWKEVCKLKFGFFKVTFSTDVDAPRIISYAISRLLNHDNNDGKPLTFEDCREVAKIIPDGFSDQKMQILIRMRELNPTTTK